MDHLSSTILMCAILLLFYASGTVKGVALDEVCTNSTTDPCTDTNANTVCSNASGTFKCSCKSTHYKNGTECKDRIAVNATCASAGASNQCVDDNAMCTDDSGFRCLCKSTYYQNGTACSARIAVNATCASAGASNQCADDNAMCTNDSGFRCLCKSTYYQSGTACNANSDAATIMLAHMHVFIFGTVASLYFLV